MPIEGILIGEHALCESLADDSDGLFALSIERVEITASDNGNAESSKESGRDDTEVRPRILFTGGMNMTVGGELQAGTEIAGIAPGGNNSESGLLHARQRINAANRFLIEIDHLLRCFSVGHGC